MKLLSLDVGVKNLAYCLYDSSLNDITDWKVINLCENDIIKCCECSNKAKYCKDNKHWCLKHGKKTKYLIPTKNDNLKKINKMKLQDLKHLAKEKGLAHEEKILKAHLLEKIINYNNENILETIKDKTTSEFTLIELGKRLMYHFDILFKDKEIDIVLIENQISPIANRMKTIQGMITQYFIMNNIDNIEYISSINKLKNFNVQKSTYNERKKSGIEVTRTLVKGKWIEYFKTHSKKDDLADSFLQVYWFINK